MQAFPKLFPNEIPKDLSLPPPTPISPVQSMNTNKTNIAISIRIPGEPGLWNKKHKNRLSFDTAARR